MIKTKTLQDKDGRVRAEKLLKKMTNLLSLKYKDIQGLLQVNEFANESHQNFEIPYGKHF